MGRKIKKGTKGIAAQYLTRASSLRKLQTSLSDFRRLCILKGIYPRDPKKKPKGKDKAYYHTKDILYLSHEPLREKFWDLKVFQRKYNKALTRREYSIAKHLVKPTYTLHHVVRERYRTFVDALRDLDDALCTLALFASLSTSVERNVLPHTIVESTKLLDEFLFYISKKQLIRKVFCSIKGIYIQVTCLGQNITFLIPHQFPQELPPDVDFKVMQTFLEFYCCLLKAVNYKLYLIANWKYPPEVNLSTHRAGCRFLSLKVVSNLEESSCNMTDSNDEKHICGSVDTENKKEKIKGLAPEQQTIDHTTHSQNSANENNSEITIQSNVQEETLNENTTLQKLEVISEQDKKIQTLFDGFVFFLSREVPRVPVILMLQSCGAAEVGWSGEGSSIVENDLKITHHVIDRPLTESLKSFESSREFIQPQWIFDCINQIQLLPIWHYRPGAVLPPHLSPFENAEAASIHKPIIFDKKSQTVEATENLTSLSTRDLTDQEDDNSDDCFEQLEQEFFNDLENEEKRVMPTTENLNNENVTQTRKKRKTEQQNAEEYERRKVLLSKKHKRLLERIEYGMQPKKKRILKSTK